ncbi:MAG: WD40 repeat domain-containing protein [Bacteroidetes bacterium]|nr:WD40 repeat domain-containing protein [Bacteroidota bacterium]
MSEPVIRKRHALTGHSGAVYALAQGFTHNQILSGSSDRFIASWDLETGHQGGFTAQLPAPVYSLLHLQPQNVLLAGTGAGSIHFIDTIKRSEIKILQLHAAAVFDLLVAPAHGLFFSAGADGQLAVGDTDTLELLKIRKLCTGKVRGLALHPNGNLLAVASGDGNVRIFELPAVTEIACFEAHAQSANCVSWSPDGSFLLSGGKDAHLNVWDENYNRIESIPAHNYAIYSIVWSPEGNYFATGSRDKTVKIWDPATRNIIVRLNRERFNGHHNSVNRLLWSNYHDLLISTGDDRAILAWEIHDEGRNVLKALGLRT